MVQNVETAKYVIFHQYTDLKGETKIIGMSPATEEEKRYTARDVELWRCTKCERHERFPRYNDPIKLLSTRRGRCGEFANVRPPSQPADNSVLQCLYEALVSQRDGYGILKIMYGWNTTQLDIIDGSILILVRMHMMNHCCMQQIGKRRWRIASLSMNLVEWMLRDDMFDDHRKKLSRESS